MPHLEVLATSVGLLALLLMLPGGLASGVFRLRDDWLRRVAERQQRRYRACGATPAGER